MNKKRVIIIVVIVVILVALICFISMINNKNTENEVIEEETLSNTFHISYEDVNITPGMKFDESLLPEEHGFAEIESYTSDGKDKIYTYENVEITVTSANGEEIVYSVYLLNENIETEEGIKISDSLDNMINIYGENYLKDSSNKYVYSKGNNEIIFTVENDVITSIEYRLENIDNI